MNKDHPHICLLELDLIMFDILYLYGLNSVITGQSLVLPRFIVVIGRNIVEPVIEILPPSQGILLQKIMEVTLDIVIWRREVLCEKHLDRKRLGKGRDHLSACL